MVDSCLNDSGKYQHTIKQGTTSHDSCCMAQMCCTIERNHKKFERIKPMKDCRTLHQGCVEKHPEEASHAALSEPPMVSSHD